MSTDRPDTTESPQTVDAGHFKFAMESASISGDGGQSSYGIGELNMKYGMTKALRLDGGVRVSLGKDAEDYSPFLGFITKL
ncbi:hypothetical protein HZ994_06295 [Akkermansiaceae bacterium]|nr:hypothetical protein HZ994_06295 [Akkermansiaceae bacterium]